MRRAWCATTRRAATGQRLQCPGPPARCRAVHGIEAVDIAHAIQLALAPVFLLSGIAGFLGVLTNRLARVVDRARNIERELRQATAVDPDYAHEQLRVMARRSR